MLLFQYGETYGENKLKLKENINSCLYTVYKKMSFKFLKVNTFPQYYSSLQKYSEL